MTLDSYTDDQQLVSELAKIGIKRLPDLSDKAQLEKQRRWEQDLKQGHKRKTASPKRYKTPRVNQS